MNIRKNIDYSTMFAALEAALSAEMPQMQLCCELGRIVCSRSEKGAAVAAAEYLHSRFPDASGFSPRNLRRMRLGCSQGTRTLKSPRWRRTGSRRSSWPPSACPTCCSSTSTCPF